MKMLIAFLLTAVFVHAAEQVWPVQHWPSATPVEAGLDGASLERARDYALIAGGSGRIIHRGRVVLEWGDGKKLYDIKSATKSFGAVALGLALDDKKVRLDAPATEYLPDLGIPPESNRETTWLSEITILHLATHTAGFEKPGGSGTLLKQPGSHWIYSDGGPNWLADCLTTVYGRDLEELMFERVFTPHWHYASGPPVAKQLVSSARAEWHCPA